jgi:hypothetical protein
MYHMPKREKVRACWTNVACVLRYQIYVRYRNSIQIQGLCLTENHQDSLQAFSSAIAGMLSSRAVLEGTKTTHILAFLYDAPLPSHFHIESQDPGSMLHTTHARHRLLRSCACTSPLLPWRSTAQSTSCPLYSTLPYIYHITPQHNT